jgi:hydroxyacylglutathione hydrolase
MLFRRFYDENLAQASYMIACEKTREAIVVDPNADVGHYTRAAGSDRVKIRHVAETHIHADFLSGSRQLADTAGATLHLSGAARGDWAYTDAALAEANVLEDGSTIEFGTIRVSAMHTPGHTPEHLSFLVFDLERGDNPVGVLTGDFIFVGDVGRPDLLEKAAGAKGTMEASARELYRSVQKFLALPDYLQIWPGHGAGSACGKALGSMPQSTLGYEKLFNWALAGISERDFVAKVLEDQPVPPRYFAAMKRANRDRLERHDAPPPKFQDIDELERALRSKATIVDTRTAQRFATGHIPGTVNIPLNKSFLNWSGALIPLDRDFYILSDRDTDEAVKEILGELCKIGLTRVRGIFRREVINDWKARHGALEKVAQTTPGELRDGSDGNAVQVIDVRNPDEWKHGHLPGAVHIPLAALPERFDELDASVPIVLHCKGGGRSSIAASYLQSKGLSNVSNLAGGYEAWVAEGLDTVREQSAAGAPRKRKK